MRKIRVLVVDDSVVIRKLLTDILSKDPEIEVVGTAPNGRIALNKLPQLTPDLVTLDVEMPEMDGLETLPHLRKAYPKLPVIMFSTLTARGATATLDALARGATDYVAKPANVGSVQAGMQSVQEQLLPKIKALCPFGQAENSTTKPLTPRANVVPVRRTTPPQRVEMLVIGSSTGGPQALTHVLTKLPRNFPVPIAIVQHMPPVFTQHLADRLNQECNLEVLEASGNEVVQPGQILIAPGNYHMQLERHGTSVLATLHQDAPENSCRPAVDVLFRSAAEVYGPGCLAVVLTGMGRDGLRGGQAIVQKGGSLLAQDEATSVVWGMPRAVAEAGLASATLPLNAIANELVRLTSQGRRFELQTREVV